jgi:hypothetical protein
MNELGWNISTQNNRQSEIKSCVKMKIRMNLLVGCSMSQNLNVRENSVVGPTG